MDKEAFKKDVDNEFRQLSSRIDRIRAAFESIEESDRMQFEMEVENLLQKREIARQKINELDSAKDNWAYFRMQAEVAEQDLRLAVEDAHNLLSRAHPS
ncbi:MAG: hypothetical protein ABFD62_06395 [Syntrophaceae bacterium]